MRVFFRLFCSAITFFLLAGCGPIHKKEYSYEPPEGAIGKKCVSQCFTAKSHCQKICALREESCRIDTQKESDAAYRHYQYEQQYAGKRPKQKRSSFNRSDQCKNVCQCVPAFNTCYSACGGKVQEKKA